jgi:hypothetical protein
VETQSIISKEKKEWQQGKDLLQSRIQILKKEIAEVEEKTRQARQARGDAAKARASVATDRDTVKSL